VIISTPSTPPGFKILSLPLASGPPPAPTVMFVVNPVGDLFNDIPPGNCNGLGPKPAAR
jgi:hypothetical protein